MTTVTRIETEDGYEFVDEFGDKWEMYTNDGRFYAVNHATEDKAGVVTEERDGSFTLDRYEDGKTFGVSCQDEFVVCDGRWEESIDELQSVW
jgi:hypothetical protein